MEPALVDIVQLYILKPGAGMVLTIDPSAVMAVVLNEPSRPRLIEATEGAELFSAPSLPWEVGNALSALLRRQRIDVGQAIGALAAFQDIPVRFMDVDLGQAVVLADEYGIYAYDAYIIECARNHATPLLSLDQRQCRVAQAVGVRVIEVTA